MTGSPFSALLALSAGIVVVCAVAAVWLTAIRSVIKVVAIQGLALATGVVVLGVHLRNLSLIATVLIVLAVKCVAIPLLLQRAVNASAIHSESRPLVNVPASLVATAALMVVAFASTRQLALFVGATTGALVPLGVATILIGFFVLVARRRPVFQMVGLLLVDNGITLVALLCTAGMPLLVEMGESLDLLLGVAVLMVLAQRLAAEFDDLGVDELQDLHD